MGSARVSEDRVSVLVVEDDARSGRMLAALLREDGFLVEVCPDGPSGFARLSHDPLPDVLVTDLRMPTVDGVSVARLARRRSASMPIFLTTAFPQLADTLGPSVEPVLFIKPLDYPELVRSLRTVRDVRA